MEPNESTNNNQNDQAAPAAGPQVFGPTMSTAAPQVVEPSVVPAQEPAAVVPDPAPAVSEPVIAPQVVAPAPAAPEPTMTTQAPAASASKAGHGSVVKRVVVGLAVVVVFAAGFAANTGISALNAANAKSAGKAMVADLLAGNANKAYSLASSNLRSQKTAQALLQSVGNVQTTKGAVSSENVQVNGNTAVYAATVNNLATNDSGKTNGVFVVSLVKSGVIGWKVDDVSVE